MSRKINYDPPCIGHSWGRYEVKDDRFFELVKALSVQMADRCQDGLLGPEQFAKTVVGIAGCVMVEFLYASGERMRPLPPEEQWKVLDALTKASKVPAEPTK